ncbi:MAG: hypothetical protein ACOZCL_10275 [Bacillota bacterium]
MKEDNGFRVFSIVIEISEKHLPHMSKSMTENLSGTIAEVRKIAGEDALYIQKGNEYIIVILSDCKTVQKDLLNKIKSWYYNNSLYSKSPSIGIDTREANTARSTKASVLIARYRMHKAMMKSKVLSELGASCIKQYISLFKDFMNELIENDYNGTLNKEILDISEYLDTLITKYESKKRT